MDDTAAAAPHLPATEDTVLPAAAATSSLTTPDPLPAATADAVEEGQPGADRDVPPPETPLRQRDIDRILHNAQKTHRTAVKTLEAHEGIAVLPLSSWGTESSRPSRDAQE